MAKPVIVINMNRKEAAFFLRIRDAYPFFDFIVSLLLAIEGELLDHIRCLGHDFKSVLLNWR